MMEFSDPKPLVEKLKQLYFGGYYKAFALEVAALEKKGGHTDAVRYVNSIAARHGLQHRKTWAKDYDCGFACGMRRPDLRFDTPKWQGEDLKNRTLLIWAEDGLGDFIRHLRHVEVLRAQGARIILYAPPKIRPLLKACFDDIAVPETIDTISAHDWHCPSGSLDGLLWDAKDNPQTAGYLSPMRPATLHSNAGRKPLDIGICSRSLKRAADRDFNYTDLASLSPIFESPLYQAHSLQYRDDDRELADANAVFAKPVKIYGDLDFYDDLLALSLTILDMDAVISTSSLVADLSAALGVRTLRFHGQALPYNPEDEIVPDLLGEEELYPEICWYGPLTEISYRKAGQAWPEFFADLRDTLEDPQETGPR